jgi:co-chaperonin GroES (HSP10)
MIDMSFCSLEGITPNDGVVFIKPGPENDFIHIGDGMKVWIDTTYDPLKHINTWGEVVAIPIKESRGIQKGDFIYFHYLTIDSCMKLRKYIMVDKQVYFPVPTASVFIATRNGEVICHNGYALVEPLEVSSKTPGGVIIPRIGKKEHNTKEGILRYRPEGWLSSDVGDHIVFATAADVPLEYDLHRTFDGGKRYFRMQESNVLAKRTGYYHFEI